MDDYTKDLQRENKLLDINIEGLEKRIIILQSTIESWKRCSKTQDELLEVTERNHAFDLKHNYTKKD
jgi:hypothetical protein